MKLLKRLRNKAFRDVTQLPVFRVPAELAHRVKLEKYVGSLPALSTPDLNLVETLKREGVFVTSLEALNIPSTPLLLNATKKLVPQLTALSPKPKNGYVVHATTAQIMSYPEIFLWGLEDRLLSIVENYLGLPAAYHGLSFRRDIANEVNVKSRKWHIDIEDYRVVKVIIYLKDVSDRGGPFQYLPKSLTSIAARCLKYNYGYIPDETLKAVIPESDWISCTGASGTVIFADTGSILHRGKIPVESDRFSIFFDYTSRQPKYPHYCRPSLPIEDLLLLARECSELQKECVFWSRDKTHLL